MDGHQADQLASMADEVGFTIVDSVGFPNHLCGIRRRYTYIYIYIIYVYIICHMIISCIYHTNIFVARWRVLLKHFETSWSTWSDADGRVSESGVATVPPGVSFFLCSVPAGDWNGLGLKVFWLGLDISQRKKVWSKGSFYFLVNNEKALALGLNWTPLASIGSCFRLSIFSGESPRSSGHHRWGLCRSVHRTPCR